MSAMVRPSGKVTGRRNDAAARPARSTTSVARSAPVNRYSPAFSVRAAPRRQTASRNAQSLLMTPDSTSRWPIAETPSPCGMSTKISGSAIALVRLIQAADGHRRRPPRRPARARAGGPARASAGRLHGRRRDRGSPAGSPRRRRRRGAACAAPVRLADAQPALGLDAGQPLVLDEHRQRRARPQPRDERVHVRRLALARPSRCSGRPTTIAARPSASAASWSAVRKTSASGGCAVMTPYGVASVRVGSLNASPVRLRPISRASTRPDRTAPVMSGSLPECTRPWEDTPPRAPRWRQFSRSRRRPAAIAGGAAGHRRRTGAGRRRPASPKVLDARLAQAKAEAARLAGEQRTLLTRLRQIELAIETRELEREKTARARVAATAPSTPGWSASPPPRRSCGDRRRRSGPAWPASTG